MAATRRGVVAAQPFQPRHHEAESWSGGNAVPGGFQLVERLGVREVAMVDDVDAVLQRALDGGRSAAMRGDSASDHVRGLDASRHLFVGHHRHVGRRRFGSEVA
jgi:hypothetical protein